MEALPPLHGETSPWGPLHTRFQREEKFGISHISAACSYACDFDQDLPKTDGAAAIRLCPHLRRRQLAEGGPPAENERNISALAEDIELRTADRRIRKHSLRSADRACSRTIMNTTLGIRGVPKRQSDIVQRFCCWMSLLGLLLASIKRYARNLISFEGPHRRSCRSPFTPFSANSL